MTTRTAIKPTASKTRAKALKKSSRAAELLNIVDPAVEAQEQYLAAARERARIYHLREQAIKEGKPIPAEAMPKSARGKARLEARLAAAKGTKPTKGKAVVEVEGDRALVVAPKNPVSTAFRDAAVRSDHRTMRELIAAGQAQAPVAAVAPVAAAPRFIERDSLLTTLTVLIASHSRTSKAASTSELDRAHITGIVDGLKMARTLLETEGT